MDGRDLQRFLCCDNLFSSDNIDHQEDEVFDRDDSAYREDAGLDAREFARGFTRARIKT